MCRSGPSGTGSGRSLEAPPLPPRRSAARSRRLLRRLDLDGPRVSAQYLDEQQTILVGGHPFAVLPAPDGDLLHAPDQRSERRSSQPLGFPCRLQLAPTLLACLVAHCPHLTITG